MSDLTTLTINRAVKDAWAGPQQDRQLTFVPSMLSLPQGAVNALRTPWSNIVLPEQGRRYVVYEMGQVSPQSLGFDEMLYDWELLSDVCARQEMIVNAHVNSRMVSLGTTYIRRNRNRNLIIAVDLEDNKELLASGHDLYFRMYSNVWFATTAGATSAGIRIESQRITTTAEASAFQATWNGLVTAGDGNIFCYVDGIYRDYLSPGDMPVGSMAELIVDYSGVGHFDIPINDLKHFESIMDKKRKYIIQQPDNGRNNIDFFDDLEIYLCTETVASNNNAVNVGVYYPHLYSTNTRMLTHRDYAIESLLAQNIMVNQSDAISYRNAFVRVFLRNADLGMPPIMDGSYLTDLYLLDKEERLDLMIGTNSVIDRWRAPSLESSACSLWMGTPARNLTLEALKDVYSYHGIQNLMEAPYVEGGVIRMPPMMYQGGHLFIYKDDGSLLEHRAVANANDVTLPTNGFYAETIPGARVGSGKLLERPSVQTADPADDYAQELVYKDSTGVWRLAVEGTDFTYDLDKRVANWSSTRFADTKLKRLAGKYYLREFTISDTEIAMPLPIFENNDVPTCGIPIGRLDIWIEGKRGIRNLDYVDEYPNFRILNRHHYATDEIDIKLVFHGLSGDRADNKVGILKHRLLTHNDSYDISFNRLPEIIIKGMVTYKNRVDFSEIRHGNMEDRYVEGSPYSIDYFVSHVPQVDLKQLSLTKPEEQELNKTIEAYFTKRFPEEVITDNVVFPEMYSVVSALMHKLIEEILAGNINITFTDISDEAVAAIAAPYLYILDADLISKDWVDWDFIDIHPTGRVDTITIDQRSYAFLRAVNRMYLGNRTNLNAYINVV